MAREDHFTHPAPLGILGVFPSNPEIIAVFPELSGTALPHSQEIRVRRGDSLDIDVQFQDDLDPPDPFSVSGAVIRWAAKQGFGKTERAGVTVGNEGALIVKRTYGPSEITVSGDKATVHVKRKDTIDLPTAPAIWDLEVARPTGNVVLPPNAQVQFMSNSSLVFGLDIDWKALGITNGDLFKAQGRTVLATEVVSNQHLRVDFDGWTPELTSDFQLQRANIKTVASGQFVVEGDVVL